PVERVGPARHALEEIELLPELGIDGAVRNVAACGDVDVLEHQALALAEELDADMARFPVILPVMPRKLAQRDPADRGDTMIALLALDRAMSVAERLERGVRELLLETLDLLQAQHVGLLCLHKACDLIDPQANRIDVPRGD